MLRIDSELMRQRRIQLGWTSEELAEKSGLDARTIRRLEQGKTHPRLHTAIAVARALTLDTSTFISYDVSAGRRDAVMKQVAAIVEGAEYTYQRDANEDNVSAAFKAAENTFQTELRYEGDQSFREVMHVLSPLLTKALATEGKGLTKQEDMDVYEMVSAFKAADAAIRTTLSDRRELSIEEATCVLSLLLTRYGIAFSRGPDRGLMLGLTMIDIARMLARKALADYLTPETIPGGPEANVIFAALKKLKQEEPDDGYGPSSHPLWPTEPWPAPSALQTDPHSYRRAEQEEKLDNDRSEPKVEKSRDKP